VTQLSSCRACGRDGVFLGWRQAARELADKLSCLEQRFEVRAVCAPLVVSPLLLGVRLSRSAAPCPSHSHVSLRYDIQEARDLLQLASKVHPLFVHIW